MWSRNTAGPVARAAATAAASVAGAIVLDLPGVEEPAEGERQDAREGREEERVPAGQPAVVDGRPEHLDKVRHRVEAHDEPVLRREDRRRVDDGRQEEPR